jgi:hypothetical protein
MYISKIKKCRCCKSEKIKNFIDFGGMSLTTEFPRKNQSTKKIPLNLVMCNTCKLFQLKHNYELKELYNKNYGYKSGVNETMKNHLKNVVFDAQNFCKLKNEDVVLDIASNDGTLLKSYNKRHITKIGIDPIINKYKKNYKKMIGYPGFFEKETFLKLSKGKKAKIITSVAVFYDIPNPIKFVNDIKQILDNDGIWILEQSYFPFLLKNNAFDSICHEHLSYFMYKQIKIILDKNNLILNNVKFNDMNGGSFRLFISHRKSKHKIYINSIKKLEKLEKNILDNLELNKLKFKKNIDKTKTQLLNFLKKLKVENKTVHIYGASTKGNVILQYCNIDKKLIPYAAERNPDKYGRYTPGTLIPIISEKKSKKLKPDYYLVMPWHFKNEILKREKKFLKDGGKIIMPLPKLQVL